MPKHVSTKELFISWKRMMDVGLYNIHLLLCAWKSLPLFYLSWIPYLYLMCVSGIMLLSKSACHCQNVFTFHETWAHRMVHFISKSCQFYWMILMTKASRLESITMTWQIFCWCELISIPCFLHGRQWDNIFQKLIFFLQLKWVMSIIKLCMIYYTQATLTDSE